MEDNRRIAISLVAATVIVFGGFYLLDRYSSTRIFVTEDPVIEAVPESHQADTVPEEPLPHASPEAAGDTTPDRSQVFKCMVDGKTVYADAPCKEGQGNILSMEDTSGVHLGVTRKQVIQTFPRSGRTQETWTSSSSTGQEEARLASLRLECDRLYEAVKRNDAVARQPNSPQRLDRLRVDRKKLTDRIYELNCMKV